MDRSKYSSLHEAYQKMFEAEDKPTTMPVPVPYMPLRPINVHRTEVQIDVTKDYVGPGGVEKAYYTYPASFDPTNREDVIKDKDYDGSKSRSETKVNENRMAAHTAGESEGKKMLRGSGPAKITGGKTYTMKGKDGKPLFGKNEEMEYSDLELIGDYVLAAGLVSETTQVDAFVEHMSDEWKDHVLQTLTEKERCWKGYKPTPGKEPYSDGSCTKEELNAWVRELVAEGIDLSEYDMEQMEGFYTYVHS